MTGNIKLNRRSLDFQGFSMSISEVREAHPHDLRWTIRAVTGVTGKVIPDLAATAIQRRRVLGGLINGVQVGGMRITSSSRALPNAQRCTATPMASASRTDWSIVRSSLSTSMPAQEPDLCSPFADQHAAAKECTGSIAERALHVVEVFGYGVAGRDSGSISMHDDEIDGAQRLHRDGGLS
jgi:hypothetical protein